MVALAISAILVMLVGSVFLVQNRFYAVQTARAGVHDNARSVTSVLGSELRSVMPGGIVLASHDEITIRSPLMVGVVCALQGQNVDLFMEAGAGGFDTTEMAGFALRDASTGHWSYYHATWANLVGSGGPPWLKCRGNGADTTGAQTSFRRLGYIDNYAPSDPGLTDVVMIFRETHFKIQTSTLDPSTLGLFRGAYGQPLVEYVTGLDPTAGFEYRTGGSTYATSVGLFALDSIDAVRVVAEARKRPQTGQHEDVTYGWSTDFILPDRQ